MQSLINLLNKSNINSKFINSLYYKFGIKTIYNKNEWNRLLFYTLETDKITPSNFWMNGLIVEKIENVWKIVCYPLSNFSKDSKELEKELENTYFQIHQITEGTIINMYFSELENRWNFGTRKSFDIYDEVYKGFRYSDVLNLIDTKEKIIGHTYTFSIRHQLLHPFTRKTEHHIMAETYMKDVVYSKILNKIFLAPTLNEAIKKINELNTDAKKKYLQNGAIELGYIIRGGNFAMKLESDLMEEILRLFYRPIEGKLKMDIALSMKDLNFTLVKCYLQNPKECFKIFPIFEDKFRSIFKLCKNKKYTIEDLFEVYYLYKDSITI